MRPCLCYFFYFDIVLLYGHVLLLHPRFQVYLSIFLGLYFHSRPMPLLFFSYSIYLYVVSTRPVFHLSNLFLQLWQTIIDILGVDLVVIHLIRLDFKRGYFFSTSTTFTWRSFSINIMPFFRSLTSFLRIFISFFVSVKLLLMIFVMLTSCFLNSSSNTSLMISFVIFYSSREIFNHVVTSKKFE